MDTEKIRLAAGTFSLFIYPFSFEREQFDALVHSTQQASWKINQQSVKIWACDRFPQDELLPQVSNYLIPTNASNETACLWKLESQALASLQTLGMGKNNPAQWTVNTPYGGIRFEIDHIKLILFRIGIGFLTLSVVPQADTLATWFDFMHYFRFSNGSRHVNLSVQQKTGQDQFAPFFPPVCNHPAGQPGLLAEIISAILSTTAGTEAAAAWWRDIFVPGQLLPYAGLFVEGDESGLEVPKLAYRLQNFFHSEQTLDLTKEDQEMDKPTIVPYVGNQWFLYSLEGSAFFAYNPPQTTFFKQTLPEHLQNQYFILYLLALHQRFALIDLSTGIADQWLQSASAAPIDLQRREQAFQKIREAFFLFNARGYFYQVGQKEHHHRCYKGWQQVFQLEYLYNDLRNKINDMYEYLMLVKSERLQALAEIERVQAEKERNELARREKAAEARARTLEKRLSLIAWIIGLPMLALAFQDAALGENFTFAIYATAAGLLLGLGMYFFILLISKRKQP